MQTDQATRYSLRIYDQFSAAALWAGEWRSAWPLLPDFVALRAANPDWLVPGSSNGVEAVLRAEYLMRGFDGKAVTRQVWLGSLEADKLVWHEARYSVCERVVIGADLDGEAIFDEYGGGIALADAFPDIPGLLQLEEAIRDWAWAYDMAYWNCRARRADICLDWDAFNAQGRQLAHAVKSSLGSRATVFYEKPSWDATAGADASRAIHC